MSKNVGMMDESLAPILAEASKCIDSDLSIKLSEDDREPIWKIAFLVCIGLKCLLNIVAHLHQKMLLAEDAKVLHKGLPQKVKDLFPL